VGTWAGSRLLHQPRRVRLVCKVDHRERGPVTACAAQRGPEREPGPSS
jgi:hypothetical protein